jgi:DNA repair exonuclease SbcCD nuclease subunit
VIDLIAADHPAFVLGAGDLSYANDNGPEAGLRWFDAIGAYARSVPLMPVAGNHEFAAGDPTGRYPVSVAGFQAPFALPGPTHGDYYSFDYGNVHVIAVPEIYVPLGPDSDFRRWLTDDLAAAARNPAIGWKVAFSHRPFYSSGTRHGGYASYVANVLPVLERSGVDLVISGHEHNYERTRPIRAGVAVPGALDTVRQGDGTVFVVTGGGGANVYDDFGQLQPWDAQRLATHEYLRLGVTSQALELTAVDDRGRVIDHVTISAT